MLTAPVALYFDFVDPLSYLVELELLGAGFGDHEVARIGFELQPPPSRLTDIDDATLAARWRIARSAASELGVALDPPRLVPWSRKAHELHLHAADHDLAAQVRSAVFAAHFTSGRDIGRIDVLLEVGGACGLDRTETKAVLDVDRFEEELIAGRAAASSSGVSDTPTLVSATARLQGFHNRTTLGTFLRDSSRVEED